MNHLQNLHIHTTYCDGSHTPREIVEIAIQKGFGSVGFSGHSYVYFSTGRTMSTIGCEQYKKRNPPATKLDCAFDESRDILLHCGYTEHYLLTNSRFKTSKL